MSPMRLVPVIAAALAAAGCLDTGVDPGPLYPPRGQLVSGDLQQDTVGDPLQGPLVLRVTDQAGVPLGSVAVTFAVVAGGGTVAPAGVATGADGQASTRWTLGTTAGDTQRVEARAVDPASGASVVLAAFRAVAVADAPAAISARPAAPRVGVAGQRLPDSLEARVVDGYGNPVPGAAVAWSANRGGTVSPAASSSDAAGIARAAWTLGLAVGAPQEAVASVGAGMQALFTATAGMPAGAQLVVVSGAGQLGTVGSALSQPAVVELRTPLGAGIAGATVAWSPSAGTVLPASAVTDDLGRAATLWTLGQTAGAQQLTATVDGVAPVTLGATAAADAAARLEVVAGNGQTAPPSGNLPMPLLVRVVDRFDNPVSGVTVSWTVLSGGGSIMPPSGVTGATGTAFTFWTLGPAVGTQMVRAAALMLTSVNVSATAVP